MTSVWRCRAGVSLVFALAASLLTWLVLGDWSPLEQYFLQHVTIPNILRAILTVPYLVLMVLRPAAFADTIGYALIFVQWLLVGFILSLLICRHGQN